MATWINHLRICEGIIKIYPNLNDDLFIVGNIAPDCGIPNKDHSSFIPDKYITHWYNKNDGEEIIDLFKERYLSQHDEKYHFYLGYYLHLLIDDMWRKYNKVVLKENQLCVEDKKKIITEIKKEWYGQDCLYLRENKDSIYFSRFIKIIDFPNIYLDYFPEDAFTRQIRYIKRFYSILNLKNEENDFFVIQTVKYLKDMDILKDEIKKQDG